MREQEQAASKNNTNSKFNHSRKNAPTSIIVCATLYSIGPKEIHLNKTSSNASRHLVNWRVHAIATLGNNSEDLHYSATLAMSKSNVKCVRETLLKALDEVLATVRQSPEEEGFVYSFDFFKI